MLFGKKKKISEYLVEKNSQSATAFDTILSEYLCGTLKQKFTELNFKRIRIYIDWLTNYKCINIQAKIRNCFFDIQIEPNTFSISYDKDEPDDAIEFELKDASFFYNTVEETICNLI